MPMIQLVHLAHARSGDKGDTANVGVIAYEPGDYEILRRTLTAEAVKGHFGPLVKGRVERFELPNLNALNFLLHGITGTPFSNGLSVSDFVPSVKTLSTNARRGRSELLANEP